MKASGVYSIHDGDIRFILDLKSSGFVETTKERERFIETIHPVLIAELKSLGFDIQEPVYIFKDKFDCYAVKGNLQFDLVMNRGELFEIRFFQNINNPYRADYNGRFDRFENMPYSLKIEVKRAFNRIIDLMNRFGVFIESDHSSNKAPCIGVDGVTAIQFVELKKDKYPLSSSLNSHYSNSADGLPLQDGQVVWFYDRKGRVNKGVAYHNINNMWWVVTGKYGLVNTDCGSIYVEKLNLSYKNNKHERQRRLDQIFFDFVIANKLNEAEKIKNIITAEFEHFGYLIERKQANRYFLAKGLSFADVTKERIDKLRRILNRNMRISGCFGGVYRCSGQTKREVFQDGFQQLQICCKSYYFKNRNCIVFYSNNKIGFAEWSDSTNLKPIYKSFIEWCDWIHEKKKVTHVEVA